MILLTQKHYNMKKRIIFIALLASFGGSLQAQDTVWQRPAPLNNYFNNTWIDTTNRYVCGEEWWWVDQIIARQFITEDTLQDALREYITEGYDSYEMCWENLRVRTFAEAGLMTYNKGLVIELPDGTEFQLTIVQSR